jgi:NADH-quinone oxidoreductase B subunit
MKLMNSILNWAQKKSLWVLPYNTGGCNGCDIELVDLFTPRFDIERLGILAKYSPRHADVLLCTGPVTVQSKACLIQIYEQMPEPKWVVAIGSCALSGGVYQGSYNVFGGIDQVIPVDIYIPGCPCRPEAAITGILALTKLIDKKEA